MPEDQNQKKLPTRKRFLWSTGVLSMLTAIAAATGFFSPAKKNIIACAPESKKKMVKMLTEDGKLVEIDASLIISKGKKISNSELQNWVTK